MPRKPKGKTVHLVLKSEYFEAIASGEKTSESRQASPHWIDRIDGDVAEVVFQLGYGRNGQPPKRMRFKVAALAIHGHDGRVIPYPKSVDAIPQGFRSALLELKLGERLE